jgi:hypothetical protein
MSDAPRQASAAKITAIGVVGALLVLAFAKVALGVGPSLPGPPIRVVLGLSEPTLARCEPTSAGVRYPANRTTSQRWQVLDPVADIVDEMRAVVAGGSVFLVGGLEADRWGQRYDSVATLFRYDASSNTVALESRLPRPLDHVLAVGRGDSIYVVGGFENGVPSARAWRYDLGDRSWSELAPMRFPRGALGGGILDGRLYAVGGSRGYARPDTRDGTPGAFASVEIYDFERDRWLPGAPLHTGRHHVASAVADGKLYIVGGRTPRDVALAERFDPAVGAWERLPSVPPQAGSRAATTVGNLMVVMGGSNEAAGWVTPAVWTFDAGTARWRRLPDLGIPRHSQTAVTHGGYVYVFAGSPCAGYGIEQRPERIRVDVLRQTAGS